MRSTATLHATATQITSTTCIPDDPLARTFDAALHYLPPSPHWPTCRNRRQQLMHARIYSTVYVYNQFFDPVLIELQGRIAAAEIVFSARGLFTPIPGGAKVIAIGVAFVLGTKKIEYMLY